MGKQVQIQNCTADPRTLIAALPSGARAILSLKPGEISKLYDEEVVSVLRSNPAVDLLFRNNLVRIYVPKTVEVKKAPLPLTAVKETPPAKAKPKGKPSKHKLDLGV